MDYATPPGHYLFMEGSRELSSSCSRVHVDTLALSVFHIKVRQCNLKIIQYCLFFYTSMVT